MITQLITDETPIAMLNVGQLKEILTTYTQPSSSPQPILLNEKRYVYGLRGIRELFSICHTTAQRYKSGILAPAIIQNGRKIIVDAELAMQLFADNQEK